jgi:hypothetical protein
MRFTLASDSANNVSVAPKKYLIQKQAVWG